MNAIIRMEISALETTSVAFAVIVDEAFAPIFTLSPDYDHPRPARRIRP